MTRNVFLHCSLLFLPPVIFVNSKAQLNSLVYTKWRVLFRFIPVILLLLFMSCSSQQIVELPEGSLITKGAIEYIPYSVGKKCTVMWNHSISTDVKYEVRLLYCVKGPNGELLKKGQGAPKTVSSNEYSFNVRPGITILSVRTVGNASAGLKKSRWVDSSDWRFAVDQKPWAIISDPQ